MIAPFLCEHKEGKLGMFGLGKKQALQTLSATEARDLADRGAITLVDVREPNEWEAGRIPGAVHAPLSRLGDAAATLPSDKPVVFYCRSGVRSAQAITIVQRLGLPHDTHMAGGIVAWQAAGLPVTR
jgi:rhodanese-related sulfurtransferase